MEPVNRSLRAYIWRRAATQGRTSAQFSPYSQAPLGHKARAACQFRARGFMKGWLTVNVPVVSRQGLGTSAAMSRLERETAGERGFRSIPALSRASNADEELAADALKGAGQPEPTVRDMCGRRMPPRSRRRISSA
jgi:hypothetical protein